MATSDAGSGGGQTRVSISKQQSPKGRRGIAFRRVGRSGLRRFRGGRINDEFIRELRGKRAVKVYKEMYDNDSVIGASMSAIEQTLRRITWNVVASNRTTDAQSADRASNFLIQCMDDMSNSWDDMISEIVTFLTYGWALMEMTLKVRNGESRDPQRSSMYDDGRIGLRDIGLRMQQSLESWDFGKDDGDEIMGMYQQGAPDYILTHIPIKKCMLFRTKAIGNNPEGRSILRNAYRDWYFKKVAQEIEAVGMERDLIGMPIIKGPPGWDVEAEENKDMLLATDELLSELRRDERDGVYINDGWEITLLGQGSQTRRQFDTDRIITRYDKRIALSVLTHTILLGSDRVGSFALSRTQTDDFFKVAIQGFLQTIASVFNKKLVPFIFSYYLDSSVGPAEYPELVPGKVSGPSLKEVADYIKAVGGAGFFSADEQLRQDLERDLYRHLGLEEAERIGGVRGERRRPKVKLPAEAEAEANASSQSSSTSTSNGNGGGSS